MPKIAILDEHNEDVGLKILYPECDYFIYKKRTCTQTDDINRRYNITLRYDIENINDKNYTHLFVITRPFNSYKIITDAGIVHHNLLKDCHEFLSRTITLINNNNFEKVCMFCTDDVEVDPSKMVYNYFDVRKDITFFLRNYNRNKSYTSNVHPFPFLIFTSNNACSIDRVINMRHAKIQSDKVFFAGNIYNKNDPLSGEFVNREDIIRDIIVKIPDLVHINHGYIPNHIFMELLSSFKYCLDLIGCGNPNIRTFEILGSGSLLISQRTNMKWHIDEPFAKETYFTTVDELKDIINRLNTDPALYQKCLEQQYTTVAKYMNREYLRKYIEDIVLV